MDIQQIHNQALFCAKNYRLAEVALIDVLQKVEEFAVFRKMGFSSLFQYCLQALSLSESTSYNLIGIARKAKTIPQLKEAIQKGNLNVSNARRIVPVLTPQNQENLIQDAIQLSQRDLEKKLLENEPQKVFNERLKPIARLRSEFKIAISNELEEKLKKIRDLVSTQKKRAVNFEEALESMANLFLEKKDPIQKVKRLVFKRVNNSSPKKGNPDSLKRRPIPEAIKQEVILRENNQCSFIHPTFGRCKNTRWNQFHHIKPVVDGGRNTSNNLKILCFHHHNREHDRPTRE